MADKERAHLQARIGELRLALHQSRAEDVQRTLHEALRVCEQRLSELEEAATPAR